MYPGMPLTTSSLFKNSPHPQQNQITFQQNQNSDLNAHAPSPVFQPIQLGFGENYYDNFQGQPNTYISPALIQAHGYQGFSFQDGQLTNNIGPFYGQGSAYQYPVQMPLTHNYFVSQQSQPHQVERNVEEVDISAVEPECPVLPVTKSRLRWTSELQECFNNAVQELGGCFKATPKKILEKMNVRGVLTTEQIKSHLQKVRKTAAHTSSITGIPDSEAHVMTNFESGMPENERVHQSSES